MSFSEELILRVKEAQTEIAFLCAYAVLEYWLGKTPKTKAGSVIEFILTKVLKKEPSQKGEFMETSFGKLKVSYAAGQVELSYPLVGDEQPLKVSAPIGALAVPVIAGIEEKVQSGEIDPIKGTDIDKDVLLKGLAELKKLFA